MKNEELTKIINSSGYPLQIRVQTSFGPHGDFNVYVSEHPWREKESGADGYIDLVLNHGIVRFIIECKRPTNTKLVFLLGKEDKETPRARCAWISNPDKSIIWTGWHDFDLRPKSFESPFCAGFERKQDSLERISGEVLLATECFAKEEIMLSARGPFPGEKFIYVPQ